jgi:hypothetical protein
MSFEEDFMEHLLKRIENPGEVSSTEVFTVRCSREDMERLMLEMKTVEVKPLPIELPEE